MLLGSHLEEITSISTMQRRLKGFSFQIPVNYLMTLSYTTAKWGELIWWSRHLLKSPYQLDRSSKFPFYLRLFFDLFDVALVNSFIVYKKLENKDLTLKEFKMWWHWNWSLPSSAENYLVHPNAPKLKDKALCLNHICQFSWRQDGNVLYAPKQEKRTEHLLRVYYVI